MDPPTIKPKQQINASLISVFIVPLNPSVSQALLKSFVTLNIPPFLIPVFLRALLSIFHCDKHIKNVDFLFFEHGKTQTGHRFYFFFLIIRGPCFCDRRNLKHLNASEVGKWSYLNCLISLSQFHIAVVTLPTAHTHTDTRSHTQSKESVVRLSLKRNAETTLYKILVWNQKKQPLGRVERNQFLQISVMKKNCLLFKTCFMRKDVYVFVCFF